MSGMMRKALGRSKAAKVSICVPCRDTVHAAFAFDLAKLMQHCQMIGIENIPHFCIGTLIVNQRDQLAEMAIEAGSTHIMWLDSDMMFPPDTIQRLLAHDAAVVAGNYVTRQYPHKTVAYREMHDWRSYVINDGKQDLISVAAVGMGCMLVNTDVIKKMSMPRFQTTWIPETQDHMGEDFFFCQQAIKLGYEILIDDALSRELQHLGTVSFNHSMVKAGLV
jgi:hypothetical protein